MRPHWVCSISRKVHRSLCIGSLEHQHSHILSGDPQHSCDEQARGRSLPLVGPIMHHAPNLLYSAAMT